MISKSEEQTKQLAKKLVQELKGSTVLALSGDLGSGKTTFVQGIAEALGISRRVLSPTFVFLRSYGLKDTRFTNFHHFDLYRCSTEKDCKSIGLEEILNDTDSLVVIEWPEVAKELLPENTKWLTFTKVNETQREIEIN